MVQNTGGINRLESQILVVEVTNEQTLGCESIGLHVDIGPSDAAEETGFSDIGITADQKSTSVGVDRWETAQMLSDLIKIQEGVLEALDKGSHATQGSLFQLLALEQRLSIFEKSHVIAGDRLNEMLGGRQLTKGNLEVVGIVERVEEILVERMDVLEARETVQNGAEFLGKGLLSELDLSRIESCL
jgi:hypothetical protein